MVNMAVVEAFADAYGTGPIKDLAQYVLDTFLDLSIGEGRNFAPGVSHKQFYLDSHPILAVGAQIYEALAKIMDKAYETDTIGKGE